MFPLSDSVENSQSKLFSLTKYDRTPSLFEGEQEALEQLFLPALRSRPIRKQMRSTLDRLLTPLDDAFASIGANKSERSTVRHILCWEMHSRQSAFWAWTLEEWQECVTTSHTSFTQRYGWGGNSGRSGRQQLCAVVYLLAPTLPLVPLFRNVHYASVAKKIFGTQEIDTATTIVITILRGWGYQHPVQKNITACLSYLFLRNRSAHLEELSKDFLEQVLQEGNFNKVQDYTFQISRALFAHGSLHQPVALRTGGKAYSVETAKQDGSIAEEWLHWCQRWKKQSTRRDPSGVFYALLEVGRWLKVHHSDVSHPENFTYELAAELVSAILHWRVGEWGKRAGPPKGEEGRPLRPQAKGRILDALRAFFRDCQEWEWISARFNPLRAFRTPSSLRRLMGPDPRVIDKEIWAKLVWAAMNIQEEDIPQAQQKKGTQYPLAMIRAVAMVWCFAALRSDEIQRLRVGCTRLQQEDVLIPETSEILSKDTICFLDIPVNKTTMAYTKPVHPLVGQRIKEWEQVRPSEQLQALDEKTGEMIHYLFSYRGRVMAKRYINSSLIPILCQKAGIPLEDSRERISSHRARATIASMLYNAKDPLDALQIKEYLGHKYLTSTQSYLKVDPTKLASKVAKTGYLEQNLATIEVLLDQKAVLSGAAAHGEMWKYYDLGHGYCVNTFWAECKHRMACARCPFYRPKDSLQDQLIEGKANLVRMLEFVSLTEDEKVLVTEGIELHQDLIEKLADVPTPPGPTPRELEVNRKPEKKVIPLRPVQRELPKATR